MKAKGRYLRSRNQEGNGLMEGEYDQNVLYTYVIEHFLMSQ